MSTSPGIQLDRAADQTTHATVWCEQCSRPLPLRPAEKHEVAATWECCYCGARYRGLPAGADPLPNRRNVRRVCRG